MSPLALIVRLRLRMSARKNYLRIPILGFVLFVLYAVSTVIPALSVDSLDDDCANSSLWTETDVDAQEALSPETPANVILVMLDGVRWQEVATRQNGAPIFSYLQSSLSGNARLFMNDRVANPYRVSLPAYQSIFAGSVQACAHNKCGRVSTETFPERFVHELKLHPKKVATLASWNRIACAVESKAKTTFVNAGDQPVFDGPMDAEQRHNNRLQGDRQWESENYRKAGRLDEHTYRHAMTYLQRHQPNFMFISFVDADFYGHQQDYAGYLEALHRYDRWIEELITTLNEMGEYGRKTAVIVTTDHGRGATPATWGEHGVKLPESGRVWTYVRLPENGAFRIVNASQRHSHVDLRPTIESLLGLKPRACVGCGKSFVARTDANRRGTAVALNNALPRID
jgi:hypothetical protein